MRLSSFFVVTFGIGVISYPAMHMPRGGIFFADEGKKQAEPIPKPSPTKTDFAYRIIVNIPATKLSLLENGVPIKEFPIAVGQATYKTPTGSDEIKEVVWNPWWYPPNSEWAKDEKITPPGPRNPLGPEKMELGDEIRIHGTSKPWSIGRAASHGCVRMLSEDAAELAWFLQSHLTDKSDPSYLEKYKKFASSSFRVKLDRPVSVDLIYEPIAFLEDYLFIYPDLYNKVKDPKELAEWKLFVNGIDPWALSLDKIEKTKEIVQIDISTLRR